jgi:hypothetical protein
MFTDATYLIVYKVWMKNNTRTSRASIAALLKINIFDVSNIVKNDMLETND